MNPIVQEIFKYVLAAIFILLGFAFLGMYLGASEIEAQPKGMLVGSLFLLVAGILILPFISERISGGAAKAMLVVGVLASAYLAYAVYDSVTSEMTYLETQEQYNARTIQRLVDIREAEEAYNDKYGHYTNNFDDLKAFVLEPTVALPYRSGTFHDSLLTDGEPEEYYRRGLVITRGEVDSVASVLGMAPAKLEKLISEDKVGYKIVDTTYVSFFENQWANEIRTRKKLPPISLDSLVYTPGGYKFLIDTSSTEIGGVRVPTIEVKDPHPYGRDHAYLKKDTLMFGSLIEAHTDGNWRE